MEGAMSLGLNPLTHGEFQKLALAPSQDNGESAEEIHIRAITIHKGCRCPPKFSPARSSLPKLIVIIFIELISQPTLMI